MAEQIPKNSPKDPTTTLAEAVAIDADIIKVPLPVVYPLSALSETYRLEVGAEPTVEYMRVDDVSGLATGELGVTRAAEDATENPAQAWPAGTPVRLVLTHGALQQILADAQLGVDEALAYVYDAMTYVWTDGRLVHNDSGSYPDETIAGTKRFAEALEIQADLYGSSFYRTIEGPTPLGANEAVFQRVFPTGVKNLQLPDAPAGRIFIVECDPETPSGYEVSVTIEPGSDASLRGTTVHLAPGTAQLFWLNDDATLWIPIQWNDTLGALAPPNDYIPQRKAGVWTSRSLAQFRADLQALASWTFSSVVGGPNGTNTAPSFWVRATNNGMYSAATSTLNFAAGGVMVAALTSALMAITGAITATSYVRSYAGVSDSGLGIRIGSSSYGFWSQSNKLHVISGGVRMATFDAASVTEFLLRPVRFALGWYVTPKKLTAASFALESGTTYSYTQSSGDSQDIIVTEIPPAATLIRVYIAGEKQGQNYEVIDAMIAYGGGPGAATVPIEVGEGYGLTIISTINTDGGSKRVKTMVTDNLVLTLD